MPGGAGRYQLLGEIGRGGMGAVLKGRDPDLGRDLAVKVLLEEHRDDPELVRRFVEEAQIGGQLQHPGIVPVYELGQFADGRPYFTMKLVKGRTLAALLEERGDPAHDLPRFLAIFEQVCQTMAYAHARGVIHRDLKPSNIMVGRVRRGAGDGLGPGQGPAPGGTADEPRPQPDEAAVSVIRTVRSGSDADQLAGRLACWARRPTWRRSRPAATSSDRRAGRRLRAGLDPVRDPDRPAGVHRPVARGDPPQGEARRHGRRLRRLDGCGADAELVGPGRGTAWRPSPKTGRGTPARWRGG